MEEGNVLELTDLWLYCYYNFVISNLLLGFFYSRFSDVRTGEP